MVAFFLDKRLEENSLQEIRSSLINQAYLIEDQVKAKFPGSDNAGSLDAYIKKLRQQAKCRITVIDSKGVVLNDSEDPLRDGQSLENHLFRPEVRQALSGEVGDSIRYSSTLKMDMFYVALPIKDSYGIKGVLRLSLPLTNIQNNLSAVRKTIFVGILFGLILALVFGTLLARALLAPINKIILVSQKFSHGDFSRRIPNGSHDEIAELALTLNKMAQDIEDKISQITRQNQHLGAILNSMIEGVVVLDKNGHIVSLNHSIEKIFSVSRQEAENKLFLQAIPNNDISEIINEVLKGGKALSRELNLVWPVQRIFQLNATPIFEKNSVIGCLVVIHDITEIRKLESMRRDFVANVSHELKTPLTSIKGFVETLLEGAMDDQEHGRQFLKIIQNHADRLNNLINDLLDLSSMESREIVLRKEDFNLRELVGQVVFGFNSQLKKKNIEITNGLPAFLMVRADRNRVEQVITNLLDNALKFNKDGGNIKIYADDSQDVLKVFVEDTGIGIPAKDIPRIFERFYRVDKARSREMGGTGLGLSIVKHIAELHGGSVGVESIEGLGSKFWFTISKGMHLAL